MSSHVVTSGDFVHYDDLMASEREMLHKWLRAHGVPLERVPCDTAGFELDAESFEFRIPVHVLSPRGGVLLKPDLSGPVIRILRRRPKWSLPWPRWGDSDVPAAGRWRPTGVVNAPGISVAP